MLPANHDMATVTEDQNDNKLINKLSNSRDQNRQGNENLKDDQIKIKRFNAVYSTLFTIRDNEQSQNNSQKHAQNRNKNRNAHIVPVHTNNSQNNTYVQSQSQPQKQHTQNTQQTQQRDNNDDDDTIMIKSQPSQVNSSTQDIELDNIIDEVSTKFLTEDNEKSESSSQTGISSKHTSIEAKQEESDYDVGHKISDADTIKYRHWIQEKWMIPFTKHKISFILDSDRIKDPESIFVYIMYLRAIYEHPKYQYLALDTIDKYPELIETRCGQLFSSTPYALYKYNEDRDDLFLVYPIDDYLYYTNLAMEMNLPALCSVVETRVKLLGIRVGKPNEANDLFDDYVPPSPIDITDDTTDNNLSNNNDNINNQNQGTQDNEDINMGARAQTNQRLKIQNKDQQTRASQYIVSRKLNKDRNARAHQQTGFENDLLRTSSLSMKPRIGNIGTSPTNIRRDSERSNVRNDVRSRIGELQKEIQRLQALSDSNNNDIPQSIGNTNNNNNSGILGSAVSRRVYFEEDSKYDTDNERREKADVAGKELQKLIERKMFEEATTLNFKYDGSDKTPGNSLHFLNQVRLWYKRCETAIFKDRNIKAGSTQLLLTQALTKALTPRTRAQFKQRPLQAETVDNWLKRFHEIISIDEDFKNHFNLLKNFRPPKDTKIEKYIPVFKDAKAIHDMIVPYVEQNGKISNMQHFKFKDAEAIYEAVVSNMNQKIISEVRKYLFDKFDSIDWTYLEENSPGHQPHKTQNINDINVLQTGILNLAKYTRDIRTNDKAGTKHNDSILEYPIMEPQSTKKKYENDHATSIGNAVNAMDHSPRGGKYDQRKYRGGYRRNYIPYNRTQDYNKRQKRDKYKNDYKRNYDNNGGYSNNKQRKNMPGFTSKTIKINNKQCVVYNIQPNTQASDYFAKKQLIYFSRKNKECRICPQSDNSRFGHSTEWHYYLKNNRSGAIQKLSNIYFSSKKKRKRRFKNQTNAIDDQRRLSNMSQHGQGRSRNKNKNKDKNKSKNKDKRGKTNTVGALAMQDDGTDRGGIVTFSNNTFGNTTNQAFNNEIEDTREHNSNMLAAFQSVKNDNKTMKQAKASNETNPNL